MKSNRRDFLKKSSMAGAGLALIPNFLSANSSSPSIAFGRTYMGGFAAPKIETLRCAFIGVGARGAGHAGQIATIEGTEVVAISDLYEDLAKKSADKCKEIGKGQRHTNIATYYGGVDDWKKMLNTVKPDVVFISTPWKLHAPMAIGAMKAGAHACVEVPIAVTIKEMWDIVKTSEKTLKHCMMMENVNYGREELLYLNMCRKGVIGELLHGEAAYIHELRGQMHQVKRGTGSWRTYEYVRDGNLYPTHGLGPVAQYMNLARGEDNFERLSSFSSPGKGRNLYAKEKFESSHKWNQINFKGGDINTSIIKTTLGRTIMVQWDETSPRPYSRHNLIQGTKGTLTGFPTRIALDGGVEGATKDHHQWAQGDQLQEIFEKYEHPLYKRLGEVSKKMGGHGGMDFMMLYRIVECLRNGLPLDQNVYEGCFWSAVGPLSEDSIKEHGNSQKFPDFTRGQWKTTAPLDIIS
ncbi:Gfo/Idh/MocA family oxidoreductase [Tamlana sp. 2201CG12-4]|uniref:Gfo/Idh/MocA family protein n=1 Tax=Tamlana sp. 2201CG12-4 TaxID=3112582 RepID=UPI002DBA58E5|nr:Gfo/Idh/MocA family oxidoreductase [Tamlana sp. 2201CG12-4]MEC3907850.1 Gfo/Idh/MocA family oxidoreductase [Tamlana sp. 2201CG12-4]